MTPTRTHIEFAPAARKAPAKVVSDAIAFFEQLADDLALVPEDSAFWDSMQVSMLSHSMEGWSFLYRFDGRTLCVYDARPE